MFHPRGGPFRVGPRFGPFALLAALAAGPTAAVTAAELLCTPVSVEGKLAEADDLSGVAKVGELLVIGSDEGASVQVLGPAGKNRYRVLMTHDLLPGSPTELDIEAIAAHGDVVYVAGSHGRTRKRVRSAPAEDSRTLAQNQKRLETIEHEASRDHLFRFTLAADGNISGLKSINLRPVLAADPILGPFAAIPSKENGLDIEGLAVDGEELVLGFRGPVLRENWSPVLFTSFDRPAGYRLQFVNLGGLGVRELVKVRDGYLLIAGPVGDARGPNLLYHWDGRNMLPGRDATPGKLESLGPFPSHLRGAAEGMTVLREGETQYELIVAFDGGDPPLWSVTAPRKPER